MLTKKLYRTYTLLGLLALISACTSISPTENQNAKMMVQKGIQPILSQSYEFYANIHTQLQQPEEIIKKDPLLGDKTMTASGLFILQNTDINMHGAYDSNAKKFSALSQIRFKTRNIDIALKAPMLIDTKEQFFAIKLKDFNPVLFLDQPQLKNYENKTVKFSISNEDKINSEDISKLKSFFDSLDESKFTLVALDRHDRQIKGRNKVRLLLDHKKIDQYLSTTEENKTDTGGIIAVYFTLDTQGNVVRINGDISMLSALSGISTEELLPGSAAITSRPGINIIANIDYKNFGQTVTLPFNPDHSEMIDINTLKDKNTLPESDKNLAEKPAAIQLDHISRQLASYKIATEAALFEGKKPVANQTQANKNPSKNEWIGHTPTDITRFTLNQNPKNKSEVVLMETFTEKADPVLKGKAIAFKRTADGSWHCVFYRGSTSAKFDNSIVPDACTISNKTPNASYRDIVPPSKTPTSKQVFSNKSLEEQISLIELELRTTRNHSDDAYYERKIPVNTEQEEQSSPAKKKWVNFQENDITTLKIFRTQKSSRLLLLATFNNNAHPSLQGSAIAYNRTENDNWHCLYITGTNTSALPSTHLADNCRVITGAFQPRALTEYEIFTNSTLAKANIVGASPKEQISWLNEQIKSLSDTTSQILQHKHYPVLEKSTEAKSPENRWIGYSPLDIAEVQLMLNPQNKEQLILQATINSRADPALQGVTLTYKQSDSYYICVVNTNQAGKDFKPQWLPSECLLQNNAPDRKFINDDQAREIWAQKNLNSSYLALRSTRNKIEDILKNGKIPVLTKEEEKAAPNTQQWIGRNANKIDFSYSDKNKTASFTYQFEESNTLLENAQLQFTRTTNGQWQCILYSDDISSNIILPENCTLSKGKATIPGIQLSGASEKRQLQVIYSQLNNASKRIAYMVYDRNLVTQRENQNDESSEYSESTNWIGTPNVDIVQYKVVQHVDNPEKIVIQARFNQHANAVLSNKALTFKRDNQGQWACILYTNGETKLDQSILPKNCILDARAPNLDFVDFAPIKPLSYAKHNEKNQLLRVYGGMKAMSTETEVALLENKRPVATKEETLYTPESEWIGYIPEDITYFHLYQNKKLPEEVALISVFNQSSRPSLTGKALVLTRNEEGLWNCIFYMGNTNNQEINHNIVPKSCTISKESIPEKFITY